MNDIDDVSAFAESDNEDEPLMDWRSLNKASSELPKRGEKDFGPDGTRVQMSLLDDATSDMFRALDHPRGHHRKQELIGVWMGDGKCLVPHPKGSHFKDTGKAAIFPKQKLQGAWLTPLEAVYLVERGTMAVYLGDGAFERYLEQENTDFSYETALFQLSLSHLYALALPGDGDVDRYQVYAHLKRLGYIVQDFRQLEGPQKENHSAHLAARGALKVWWKPLLSAFKKVLSGLFSLKVFAGVSWGFRKIGLLSQALSSASHYSTKHYFSYTSVFKSLQIIPAYSSFDSLKNDPVSSPYKVDFNVWKPTPQFSKKNPPMPDFQVCVVNIDKLPFPRLEHIQQLFNEVNHRFSGPEKATVTTPRSKKQKPAPPTKKEARLKRQQEWQSRQDPETQRKNKYAALRDGMLKFGLSGRSINLGILSHGVLSFSKLSEADFSLKGDGWGELNELYKRDHGIVWAEK